MIATPGALAPIEKSGQQPGEFLARHVSGDWGDVPPEDSKENELSLQHGFRLLSAYHTSAGDKLWVISQTSHTGLLPSQKMASGIYFASEHLLQNPIAFFLHESERITWVRRVAPLGPEYPCLANEIHPSTNQIHLDHGILLQ